jgi:N-hydroxyarylamine O-acetyltransferase
MRVNEDPDLGDWLSRRDADAFCERLGVAVGVADVPTLRALVRAYLGKIPFHNIHMLVRYGREPTRAEILGDMRRGLGGPCNVMNPFFAAFLARLGYDVTLLSGSMQQPDCHIALCVRVAGDAYWIDVGNGHPYLEPIAFGDEAPRFSAGLAYRLISIESGGHAIEHQFDRGGPWKTCYTFTLEPRAHRFFAAMIAEHHTQPGFGPFMTGVRLIRVPDGSLTAIRDNALLTGRDVIAKHPLVDREALMAAVSAHFGDVDLPILQAIATLEKQGITLFSSRDGQNDKNICG